MAALDLCTFNHGLGIYIRILCLASAREELIEYKCPIHGEMNTNYGCHELYLKSAKVNNLPF